jgi:hypothetical protein
VNDCRLYRAGYQAAVQAAEYELSSQRNSPTEEEIAHQHLAIAQFTGESVNPQVFSLACGRTVCMVAAPPP